MTNKKLYKKAHPSKQKSKYHAKFNLVAQAMRLKQPHELP